MALVARVNVIMIIVARCSILQSAKHLPQTHQVVDCGASSRGVEGESDS